MDILIKVLQFVLSFSLLVIVHECGHFLFAKLFGVRVERFSLFFGKPIVSFKRGDTTYCIGWIPFGGYVKLAGMIDESLDTEQMASEPQPYEFRSKPAWQRLLIMIGGVLMNVILAFVIYAGMSYAWGDKYFANSDMRYGYLFSDEAKEMGFRDGDKIISVNGKEIDDWMVLFMDLMTDQKSDVLVERSGETVSIRTPEFSISKMLEEGGALFMQPRHPFVVSDVTVGGNAERAGFQPGDSLVSFNGRPMQFADEYTAAFAENAGHQVVLGYARDSLGTLVYHTAPVEVSGDGFINVLLHRFNYFIPYRIKEYTFLQSFPAGFKKAGREIDSYWKQLKLIVKPKTEAYKSLGGPLSIGNIFPSKWNWQNFWSITALLSIALAVMNILPIPALDGGHVLFLLFEMITGRKPGDRFMLYAQMVGMAILFAIMFMATCNDINRFFIQ